MRFGPHQAAIAFSILISLHCSAAADPRFEEAIERATSAAETVIADGATPGLSLAAAVDGDLVWSAGFGVADREHGRPIESDTRFGIGSITKTLTMVLCARLVQAGVLDWDAPVESVLRDFPHAGRGITLRSIGTHLSGLDDSGIAGLRLTMESFNTIDAYRLTVSPPPVQPPWTTHLYGTGTFNVVAAVIERTTGSYFTDAMRKFVLDPLGLDSIVPNDPGVDDPSRTAFYEPRTDGSLEAVVFDPSHKLAGAGYLSTAADLVRFGSALLDPTFLDSGQREILFTDHATQDGEATGFGLGWRITEDEGERVVLQAGGGPGISCYLVIYPERRLVVAALTNLTGAPSGGPVLTETLEAFKRTIADSGS